MSKETKLSKKDLNGKSERKKEEKRQLLLELKEERQKMAKNVYKIMKSFLETKFEIDINIQEFKDFEFKTKGFLVYVNFVKDNKRVFGSDFKMQYDIKSETERISINKGSCGNISSNEHPEIAESMVLAGRIFEKEDFLKKEFKEKVLKNIERINDIEREELKLSNSIFEIEKELKNTKN